MFVASIIVSYKFFSPVFFLRFSQNLNSKADWVEKKVPYQTNEIKIHCLSANEFSKGDERLKSTIKAKYQDQNHSLDQIQVWKII